MIGNGISVMLLELQVCGFADGKSSLVVIPDMAFFSFVEKPGKVNFWYRKFFATIN